MPARRNHYVGFAGGSGITPVMSLLKTALLTEPDSRFTLFYGNRDSQSVIFLEALAELKNRFMDRLRVHHFLAEEAEDIELFNGMLDRAKVRRGLEQSDRSGRGRRLLHLRPRADDGRGRGGAARARRGQGPDPSRALHRRPAVGGAGAANAALQTKAAGACLLVTLDGRKRRVAFDAEAGNILDSARAAGLPAPFACKAGVCATCRARVSRARSRWPRATASPTRKSRRAMC